MFARSDIVHPMHERTRFVLCSAGLLLAAAIWGFSFVVVKDSLDFIGPVWMMAFRFLIAAFILCAVLFPSLVKLSARAWMHGAILGIYLFLAYLVQTIGCVYTTAGKNAFLTTIYVFLVPLLSWVFTRKRPAWYVFLCAVMSVAGIGLLALGTDDTGRVNIGDILTLACGFFYAVHIIATSKYNREHSPFLLSAVQFLTVAVLSWLSAPFMDGPLPVTQLKSSRIILSLLYLAIPSTLMAFVLQSIGLKYVSSAWASLLMSFESVFGVLLGVILLGEMLTARMTTGCVLIFVAVVLAQVLPEILDKNEAGEKP